MAHIMEIYPNLGNKALTKRLLTTMVPYITKVLVLDGIGNEEAA